MDKIYLILGSEQTMEQLKVLLAEQYGKVHDFVVYVYGTNIPDHVSVYELCEIRLSMVRMEIDISRNLKRINIVGIEVPPEPKRETLYSYGNNEGEIDEPKPEYLWVFLLNRLMDVDSSSFIRWTDESGAFQFIKPETIARQWGKIKNNDQMTYEKLSRACRYYIKSGIMSKTTERYGYRFSIEALQSAGCQFKIREILNEY